MNPTPAPPKTSHVAFTLNRINKPNDMTEIKTVSQSTSEARARYQVTAAISPNEAVFTPSRNPPARVNS